MANESIGSALAQGKMLDTNKGRILDERCEMRVA